MENRDRTPHNEELEKIILGCYMVDVDAPIYARDLTPSSSDFYLGIHQQIWDHIWFCLQNNQRPTLDVIIMRMMDDNSLDNLPGQTLYISQLTENAFGNQYDLERHVRLLKEFAGRRDLIADAAKAVTEAHNLDTDFNKIISSHMGQLATTAESFSKTNGAKSTATERLTSRYKGNGPEPVTTGLADLDKMLDGGFCGPHLVYVAGRPGMGKTSYALNNLGYESALAGRKVLFISFEMSEDQLMARLGSMHTGISARNIMRASNGNLSEGEYKAVKAVYEHVDSLSLKIDDHCSRSVEDIKMQCLLEQGRYGLDLVIIDYVQLVTGEGYNGNERMTRISGDLKQLSRQLNCPVVALSQLSRAVESRGDKRPMASDLRDSGSLEQDGSYLLFLYRDEVYHPDTADPNIAEFILPKSRDGVTGTVKTMFDKPRTCFRDLDEATKRQLDAVY